MEICFLRYVPLAFLPQVVFVGGCMRGVSTYLLGLHTQHKTGDITQATQVRLTASRLSV